MSLSPAAAPSTPSPGLDPDGAAESARRARLSLRVAVPVVLVAGVIVPLLLGQPGFAGLSAALAALMVGSDLWLLRRPSALHPVSVLCFGGALAVLLLGSLVFGVPAEASVYFSGLVLLGAAHILGARSALLWAVPAVLVVVAASCVGEEGLTRRTLAECLARVTGLLGILGFAVLFRSQRDRHAAELDRRARTDSLTGLANRHELLHSLEQALARAKRFGRRGSLLFVDLDDLKGTNDRHGHAAGDALLRSVAGRMAEMTRKVDTAARFGGDEFVVLLSEVDPGGDVRFAERLVRVLAEPVPHRGRELRTSASVGLVRFPEVSDEPEILLRRADEAMYQAKRAGGGRITVCSSEGLRDLPG